MEKAAPDLGPKAATGGTAEADASRVQMTPEELAARLAQLGLGTTIKCIDDIRKPDIDTRQYRLLRLPNELEVKQTRFRIPGLGTASKGQTKADRLIYAQLGALGTRCRDGKGGCRR
jgi:hypothetical protein